MRNECLLRLIPLDPVWSMPGKCFGPPAFSILPHHSSWDYMYLLCSSAHVYSCLSMTPNIWVTSTCKAIDCDQLQAAASSHYGYVCTKACKTRGLLRYNFCFSLSYDKNFHCAKKFSQKRKPKSQKIWYGEHHHALYQRKVAQLYRLWCALPAQQPQNISFCWAKLRNMIAIRNIVFL